MQKYERNGRLHTNLFFSAMIRLGGILRAKFALALGISLVLQLSDAHATNWYVRPTAVGANNGTDWNNAWTVNTIAWANVNPGDTIWLAGGTYSGSINPKKSGTTGSFIYVKRVLATDSGPAAAAGWNPSFDSQVIVAPTAAIPLFWNTPNTGSYLYFDGRIDSGISFRLAANANSPYDPYPGAMTFIRNAAGGQHDIIMTNIDLAGPAPDSTPFWYNGAPGNWSVGGTYSTGVSVDAGWAANYAVSNLTFSACRIHGGADLFMTINTSFFVIDNCKIYDSAVAGSPTNQPHANMFEFNNCHDFTLRNSELYHWQVEGFRPYGPAFNIYIYGNVFHDTVNSVGRVIETDSSSAPSWGPLYFYNNTIVNVQMTTFSPTTGVSFTSDSQTRNNLFWNASIGTPPSDSDYNYAVSIPAGTHSVSGSGATPLVNYAGGDFHIVTNLAANYPAGKGVNVGSQYGTDKDGTARGAGSVWDIGAYASSAAFLAPTNPVLAVTSSSLSFGSVATNASMTMSLIVQNTGVGTLTGTATTASPFVITNGNYSLGGGQSQTIGIQFSPTALGSVSQVVTLTGGAGANVTVSGSGAINPPPTLSVIGVNAADVIQNQAGLQVFAGTVVSLSAMATNALNYQWSYSVNGGTPVVFQSGSGVVQNAIFSYGTNAVGNTYVWTLSVSNSQGSAQSQLTLGVVQPPTVTPGLTFAAYAGILAAPFFAGTTVVNGATNSYISQTVQTTSITNGGSASFAFTITNAGDYVIQALVNAPNSGANSFYVNVDSQPQDPLMIWDVTLTSGFEQRLIRWRGNGTDTADQFVPKVFTLTAGTHQLIIIGREANTQLSSLSILQIPPPPQNLHILGF